MNNFKPSDTYRDETFRETQGRSHDAATKIIDNDHVAARNTSPDLQVEIARHTTSAAPQIINEQELEAVSDPTRYVDQFIYNTATSYVRKSGVDVEDLQRSVGKFPDPFPQSRISAINISRLTCVTSPIQKQHAAAFISWRLRNHARKSFCVAL